MDHPDSQIPSCGRSGSPHPAANRGCSVFSETHRMVSQNVSVGPLIRGRALLPLSPKSSRGLPDPRNRDVVSRRGRSLYRRRPENMYGPALTKTGFPRVFRDDGALSSGQPVFAGPVRAKQALRRQGSCRSNRRSPHFQKKPVRRAVRDRKAGTTRAGVLSQSLLRFR